MVAESARILDFVENGKEFGWKLEIKVSSILQGERYTLVYFAQPARSTVVQVGAQ